MILSEEEFILDNVMFWESYRWECLDFGHIYMQKFPSNKLYVGQTYNIDVRFKFYENLIGSNPHHTRALKKYGYDNVIIENILCPKYLLDTIEIFLIGFLNLTNPAKGYNKTTGGRKGYRISSETRKKISDSLKGEKHPFWGVRGEQHPSYGKNRSDETKQKVSDTRLRLGIGRGKDNPMYGKHHSEESKQIISEKSKLKIMSDDAKEKISKANKGKIITDETRQKLSEVNKGKVMSIESRQKMSASAKKRKSNREKPICAFGKLYPSAANASNMLREVCDTIQTGNFIKQ